MSNPSGYHDNVGVVVPVIRTEFRDESKIQSRLDAWAKHGLRVVRGHQNYLIFLPELEPLEDGTRRFITLPEMEPFHGVRNQARETGDGQKPKQDSLLSVICGLQGEKLEPVVQFSPAYPGGDAAIFEKESLVQVLMSRSNHLLTIQKTSLTWDLPEYYQHNELIALRMDYSDWINEKVEAWPEQVRTFHDAILACRDRKNAVRPNRMFYGLEKVRRPDAVEVPEVVVVEQTSSK